MDCAYDYLFKLVMVGNSKVGKSSLQNRFFDDNFIESYITTIGVDFQSKIINVEGKKVKLQIWDTAGQERFRTITNSYYKGANGIAIVFDNCNQESFDDIDKNYMNVIESQADKDVQLILLGNKCDLEDKQIVQDNQAQEYAQKKNMIFYQTSAKTSQGVGDAFYNVAKNFVQKMERQLYQ